MHILTVLSQVVEITPVPDAATVIQSVPVSIDWQPLILPIAAFLTAVAGGLTAFIAAISRLVARQEKTFDQTNLNNQTLITANAELTRVNLELQAKLTALEVKVERLEKGMGDFQLARDKERLRFDERTSDQAALLSTANATTQDLQARFNGQREEITALNGKVTTLTDMQTKIGSDYAVVVAERDMLKLENTRLAEKVDKLEKQMTQLRTDVDAISKPLMESNPQAAGELDAATDKSKEGAA